ncbi:FAD-dependent oxidoreductase [Irregularibacter muris]|uniref:FAD-dependent oxidoreductase n=1 Tax=Irregularibacter muris TaxID=1796619 RepID=A0AAE3L327_9FIRM|nr:FAD-dependent oxidoreductase [Irregularibacter muris]MCR1897528.1 FAD-dependent oxidoreductase [Irregularibacter muris]
MNKADCRIGVIGGGLSGLVMAEGLQRKGYHDVTLLEKDVRLGGKLHTITYKGKSYELGAIFGLPSYSRLTALMDRLNIKADGPQLSRTNYNAEGKKIMPIPRKDLHGFVEELKRLPQVLDGYESLKSPKIKDIEPALMLPFSKWCDMHCFNVLKTVYLHYFTIFGLGDIEEVPALYVLRILNDEHLMSFMEIPQFYTWKRGVSILAESLGSRIKDIRLGQKVTDITLSDDDTLWVRTPFEKIQFDQVIITAPLDNFSQLDLWDEEMKNYLQSIKYQNFNVYSFIVENVPKGCGCILENLSLSRRGHITIWDSRWNTSHQEGMVILYAYSPLHSYKSSPLDKIKDDLARLKIKKPRLYQVKQWKHCPYLDTHVLQQGFYEKMDAMQGKNNIFLAGEIMSMLSIENCIKYSEYLLEEFF